MMARADAALPTVTFAQTTGPVSVSYNQLCAAKLQEEKYSIRQL